MNKSINTLRALGIQSVNAANSGHPGIVLGAAPILYHLYADIMNVNPKDDKWINRDRFVMSAGHGSALLYATLHCAGFKLSINDLKNFRQLNSITPGHPELGLTEGVDASTGPLGQGIAMAVGIAIAERVAANQFNKKGFEIFNHKTFVLCGDGDLQEGISQEALALAGHLKLNKLVVLFDSNDIQLDSSTSLCTSEDIKKRVESLGFSYYKVEENFEVINKIINNNSDKPIFIECKTIIGMYSINQATSKVHGAPLEQNDLKEVLNKLQIEGNFKVAKSVYADFAKKINSRIKTNYSKWTKNFHQYKSKFKKEYSIITNGLNKNYGDIRSILNNVTNLDEATRDSVGKCLKEINNLIPIVSGSADLAGSTKVFGFGSFLSANDFSGRNVAYGVREFAMGSIANGITTHSLFLGITGTFMSFADYMKSSIRVGAISHLNTLFIFSHDSLMVGEDGPTHQPVEQLAMLRSIPNVHVWRPADSKETKAAFISAICKNKAPTCLVSSRQKLPLLTKSNIEKSLKGAYLLVEEKNAKATLIATGSEVSLALDVQKILATKKYFVNVVSAPCLEIFNKQNQKYIDKTLNPKLPIFSIELGSTFGWARYTKNENNCMGWNQFGFSAPGNSILKHIKFTAEDIAKRILSIK